MVSIKFQRRKVKVKIVNIIVTSAIGFKVDLTKFAKLNNFEIDEQYAVGVHCRNKDMINLVTLFRTGKVISAGTKSLKDAKHDINLVFDLIEKQKNQIMID